MMLFRLLSDGAPEKPDSFEHLPLAAREFSKYICLPPGNMRDRSPSVQCTSPIDLSNAICESAPLFQQKKANLVMKSHDK
jgi:hypothetical protein